MSLAVHDEEPTTSCVKTRHTINNPGKDAFVEGIKEICHQICTWYRVVSSIDANRSNLGAFLPMVPVSGNVPLRCTMENLCELEAYYFGKGIVRCQQECSALARPEINEDVPFVLDLEGFKSVMN
jgi:hypothetical protein